MSALDVIEDDEVAGRLGTVRAISRALAVLKAINRAGSLTIMGVSTAAGIPYATAARIVDTLILEGMIEKEPDRKALSADRAGADA